MQRQQKASDNSTNNSSDKSALHHYQTTDYGLTDDEIRKEFAVYIQKYRLDEK